MNKKATEVMGMPLGLLIIIVLLVLVASLLLLKLSKSISMAKIFP